MLWALGENDLECGPDTCLEEVAGERGTVPTAEHAMDMHRPAAVRGESNVAGQRSHFDLLANGIAKIVARLPVEIAEHRVLEGTDRHELGRPEPVVVREGLDALDDLVARGEDDGEGPLAGGLMKKFRVHLNHRFLLWSPTRPLE